MKCVSVIDNVEIKIEDANLKGYLFQYFVTISSTFLIAACAVTFGWASPTLPKLLAEESPVPITKNESSTFVSLLLLGGIIGALPGAWMMDRFGRKLTLLLATIPLFIGWILIGFGKSVEVMYASRLISGFSYGIVLGVLPMYLGEIASNNVRGSISTMITISTKYGILYAYAIAPYVSMQLMCWLAMIPIVLFICSFIWLPETPYYLLGKGYEKIARKSLIRLRGHDRIDDELHCMKENVRKANENRGTLKEFICNGNRKELFII